MDYIIPVLGLAFIVIAFGIALRNRRKTEQKWEEVGEHKIPF